MAIGAKGTESSNEAPDNRRAVPTLGGGAKVAAALEHAVKAVHRWLPVVQLSVIGTTSFHLPCLPSKPACGTHGREARPEGMNITAQNGKGSEQDRVLCSFHCRCMHSSNRALCGSQLPLCHLPPRLPPDCLVWCVIRRYEGQGRGLKIATKSNCVIPIDMGWDGASRTAKPCTPVQFRTWPLLVFSNT